MKRFFIVPALALALAVPAHADMYPDASNAKLPDARENIKAAPHVATNAALTAAATTAFPSGVWRDTFGAAPLNTAPPLWYVPSGSACSLFSGAGDNGSQVKSADNKCWLAEFPASGDDVRQFGADPSAVADSTAAIQSAINVASKNHVILPCGNYKVATTGSALTISGNNVGFGGETGRCSFLVANSTTLDIITVSGTYNTIHDLQFSSFNPRTAGSYVVLGGLGNRLYDSILSGSFIGVTISGTDAYIARNEFLNTVAATGKSIYVTNGGASNRIGYTYALGAAGAQPLAGVYIDNSQDVSFEGGSQFIRQGAGLLVAPGNGQTVASLAGAGPLYFDSDSLGGVNLCPTGTGAIVRVRFTGLWASSSGGIGIKTCAGVNGADFIDAHVLLNTSHGVSITGGTDINFLGGQFAQNGGNAVLVAGGVIGWSVTGASIGAVAGLTANVAGGVVINAGSDYFQVTGNTFVSQSTAINDASGTTHKVTYNNPGDPTDFNIYREPGSGSVVIRGQQATFSGFKLITPAATVLNFSNTGAPTMPGLPTSAGGGGLAVCVDSAGAFYKKATCP